MDKCCENCYYFNNKYCKIFNTYPYSMCYGWLENKDYCSKWKTKQNNKIERLSNGIGNSQINPETENEHIIQNKLNEIIDILNKIKGE